MKKLLIICLLCLSYACAAQSIYYIGPNGKVDNPGTQDKPFSFDYLEQKIDHSGDTIIVLEGKYPGHFNTYVYGSKDNPVTIKSDAWMKADLIGLDHRTQIPGSDKTTTKILNNYGSFSNWIDFEVYHGYPDSVSNRTSEDGKPLIWSSGFNNFGEHSNFYGIVSHDVLIGPSTWSTNIGGSIVGCVTYNVGWRDLNSIRPNQGHGHGGYTQNKADELSRKTYAYNTIWGVASEGLHLYTESENKINNFTIYKNAVYNLIGYNIYNNPERAFLCGGHYGAHNLIFSGNHVYKEYSKFGQVVGKYYEDGLSWSVKDDMGNIAESGNKHRFDGEFFNTVFENNYMFGNSAFNFFRNIKSFKGNTFFKTKNNPIYISETTLYKHPDYPFIGNTVYGAKSISYLPYEGSTTHVTFSEIGWDTNNEITEDPKNEVFFDIMPFDSKRARVIIYNHEDLDYVVTQFPFAKEGDKIRIRDAENIKEILFENEYTGNYSFNMNISNLAKIKGNIPKDHATHSDKGFNVFFVEVSEPLKDSKPVADNPPADDPVIEGNEIIERLIVIQQDLNFIKSELQIIKDELFTLKTIMNLGFDTLDNLIKDVDSRILNHEVKVSVE